MCLSLQVGGVVFNSLDAEEIQQLVKNEAKIKIQMTKLKCHKALV